MKQLWPGALAALLLALSGCAAPESAGDDQAQAQAAPQVESEAGAPPTYNYASAGHDQLSSYTARGVLAFDGTNTQGQPADWRMTVDLSRQDDPTVMAFHVVTEVSGEVESASDQQFLPGETQAILIDDGYYFRTVGPDQPDGLCMAYENTDTAEFQASLSGFQSMVDVDSLMADAGAPDLTLVSANEDANGFPSRHYQATDIASGGFQDATIDVWIAIDGGYLTRAQIADSGDVEGMGTGDFSFAFDLLTANQPLSVTPPADCTVVDAP